MAKGKQISWIGHPVLDEKHVHDLELAAAVNEFHHGLPRADAEKAALDDYRKEHHARAAAHHLNGMKAAMASGSHEDAAQHSALYRLHVKALGHEGFDAVPPEVKRYTEGEQAERTYRFKGHGADQFLVQHVSGGAPAPSMQKSENLFFGESVKCRLFGYLLELAKAQVLPFPQTQRQPTDQGKDASVQSISRPEGYHQAMRSDDYTHLLPDDVRSAGYTAFLDHSGYDMSNAKDGYAVARVMLGDRMVGSQWGYPGIESKPGEGRPLAGYPGHQHEKAVVHLPVILGEHAKRYREAWHKANDPAIAQRQEDDRQDAHAALSTRTRAGARSLAQAFRPRNQPIK